MITRRQFIGSSGAAILGASLWTRAQAASVPEAAFVDKAATAAPLNPPNGRPYNPVGTLNGWGAPWRMKNNAKESHIVAEPVRP